MNAKYWNTKALERKCTGAQKHWSAKALKRKNVSNLNIKNHEFIKGTRYRGEGAQKGAFIIYTIKGGIFIGK